MAKNAAIVAALNQTSGQQLGREKEAVHTADAKGNDTNEGGDVHETVVVGTVMWAVEKNGRLVVEVGDRICRAN